MDKVMQRDSSKPHALPRYLQIEARIRELIADGTIPAGSKLSETALRRTLSVGRTPIRQAFERLSVSGLIHKASGHGFVVGNSPTASPSRIAELEFDNILGDLPKKQIDDEAYSRLENEVVRLAVLGSWRINVSALGKVHNLSNATVYEYLARLESMGIVQRHNQSRWVISWFSPQRMEETFLVRGWLESNLLATAVVNIPRELLEAVLDNHQNILMRYPDVSGAELDLLEQQIHNELPTFSHNKLGLLALRCVGAGIVSSKHILASAEVPLSKEEPFIVEHISILEAIKRRDSEECRLRLQAHLLKSRPKVLARLAQFRKSASHIEQSYAKSLQIFG